MYDFFFIESRPTGQGAWVYVRPARGWPVVVLAATWPKWNLAATWSIAGDEPKADFSPVGYISGQRVNSR